MFRWLPVFTVSLVVLALLSSPARPAGAAEINVNCPGTLALTENQGGVGNDWGTFAFFDFHLDGPLNEDQPFTITGGPTISIAGTAEAGGSLSGGGIGTYLGTPVIVDFKGKVSLYDKDTSRAVPRSMSGTYSIGNLAKISIYCAFPPPQQIADPDNDGIDGIVIVPGNFNLLGTGVLADGQNDLRLRTQDGGLQDITLGDTSDFNLTIDKFGPANAIVERSFNRTRTQLLGTFFPLSFVNIDLPPGLGGALVQSTVTGGFTSFVKTDAAGTTILRDRSFSKGQGDPIPLLGGSETTGAWTWKTRTVNAITDFNPITGAFNASVITEFFSENLAVVPEGPATQGTVLGDPLRFQETIQGQFFPNSALPVIDNCPDVANPGQEDSDLDGNGDACDGLVWLDGNCNGLVDGRDVVRTLSGVANVAVDPAPNCPAIGAPWGQRTGGDWNCDLILNGLDVLYGLKAFAGIPDPVPNGCPAPGELVPE